MKFPEKYTLHGTFKLHSGGVSDTLYDVNTLLTDKEYLKIVLDKIPHSPHYIGIATGGAIIVGIIAEKRNAKFSMIKDGRLKGPNPQEEFILIDDVVTTEGSINEAIAILEDITPEKIFVVMDRRKDKNLAVESVFKE